MVFNTMKMYHLKLLVFVHLFMCFKLSILCLFPHLYLHVFLLLFLHVFLPFRFFLSGAEIIATAEQQLETAQGIEDTPFVTITVTIDVTVTDEKKTHLSAYQVG